VLTRQAVPTLDRDRFADPEGLRAGAYVLDREPAGAPAPDVILIASGSELAVAVAAADGCAPTAASACASCRCRAGGCSRSRAAPIGTPVLPPAVRARVAVEAGASMGWERFVGDAGTSRRHRSIRRVGAGDVVMREFGFTPAHVAEAARSLLA
jgi:transketolase